MRDTYRSVAGAEHCDLKVKGSRFIAEAFPVPDSESAEQQVEQVKRREHQATHHCTAYRVGLEGDVFRYNDDGEPSGTAGAPILRQIDARDLTNVLVVVTRYYGGTKLGTGGLARAYGDTAGAVLDQARLVQYVVRTPIHIVHDYADTSPAMHTVQQFDAKIVGSAYSQVTETKLAVRRSQVEAFVSAFRDALGGRGEVRVDEQEL